MKKIVAGFLAGALFTIGATSFADEIESLVGKKIQSETSVSVNGKELDKAIVVEGKSYAPVRSIGEAAGYTVTVEGKNVVLKDGTKKDGAAKLNTAEVKEKYRLEKIESYKTALAENNKKVQELKDFISDKKDKADKATTDKEKADYSEIISRYEQQLADYENTVKDIEANLAKLQTVEEPQQ
ncbi:hypothetical protein ABFT51_03490 [Paenibacillus peoriae]|uniref:hypothetical protein n=1 Tax=Paenibacillus peoriae TaxID=59893 RepID=UPI0032AF6CA5